MDYHQRGLVTVCRAYTDRHDQRQVEEPPQYVCPQVYLQGCPKDWDGVSQGEGGHLEVPAGIQISDHKHSRYIQKVFILNISFKKTKDFQKKK